MFVIPHAELSSIAIRGVLEEYISREGTDYGAEEFSLERKLEQLMKQLELGEVVIVFDEDSETTSLLRAEDVAGTSPS